MWFKYGLKAQKLQKQHALKAQKLQKQHALKGQKLYVLPGVLKLLPLQGDSFAPIITQGAALG